MRIAGELIDPSLTGREDARADGGAQRTKHEPGLDAVERLQRQEQRDIEAETHQQEVADAEALYQPRRQQRADDDADERRAGIQPVQRHVCAPLFQQQ